MPCITSSENNHASSRSSMPAVTAICKDPPYGVVSGTVWDTFVLGKHQQALIQKSLNLVFWLCHYELITCSSFSSLKPSSSHWLKLWIYFHFGNDQRRGSVWSLQVRRKPLSKQSCSFRNPLEYLLRSGRSGI